MPGTCQELACQLVMAHLAARRAAGHARNVNAGEVTTWPWHSPCPAPHGSRPQTNNPIVTRVRVPIGLFVCGGESDVFQNCAAVMFNSVDEIFREIYQLFFYWQNNWVAYFISVYGSLLCIIVWRKLVKITPVKRACFTNVAYNLS